MILEKVRPVQMDVCGPGGHVRSTGESRKAESGMVRIGEEGWTTSRRFRLNAFRVNTGVRR